jgi:hypothetical protein
MKLDLSVSGNLSFQGGRWFFLALVAVLIAIVVVHGGDATLLLQLAIKVDSGSLTARSEAV